MISRNMLRGGGLRVLALVAAVAALAATVVNTPTVRADEGDSLYCINNSDVKIRPYAGTGTVTDISRLVFSLRHPAVESNELKLFDAVGAKVDNQWTIINPATCKPVKITKVGVSSNYSEYKPSLTNTAIDVSSRNPHSGIGEGYNGAMVDSDGRLWFTTDDAKKTTLDQHSSETYRFTHIAGFQDNMPDNDLIGSVDFDNGDEIWGTESMTVTQQVESKFSGTVLLGHRISDTNQLSPVVQMPTTGAPEGLSTVGLAALGVGLAGVSLMLSRRRD